MGKEQYLLQLSILEQEAVGLQQQMQMIEQQNLELQNLHFGLQELEETKEKGMLANLGKGIFIKAEIQDKKLFVDVGNRIFVKKNVAETLKVIEEQTGKLMGAKARIIEKLQELQEEMEKIIVEAEKSEERKK